MLNAGMKTLGVTVSQTNMGTGSRNASIGQIQSEDIPIRIGLLSSESPDAVAAWMGKSRRGLYGRPQLAGDQSARRVILPDVYQRWSRWMQNESDSPKGSSVFDSRMMGDFENCPSDSGVMQAMIDRINRRKERCNFLPRVRRSSWRPTPFEELFTAKMKRRGQEAAVRSDLEAQMAEAESRKTHSSRMNSLPQIGEMSDDSAVSGGSRKPSFDEAQQAGSSSRKASVRDKKSIAQEEPPTETCACDSIIVKPEWMQMDQSSPPCPGPPPPPPPPETVQVTDSLPVKVLEFEQTTDETAKPPPAAVADQTQPTPVTGEMPAPQPVEPSSGETSEPQPAPVVSDDASAPEPAEASEPQTAPLGDGTAGSGPEATPVSSSDQAPPDQKPAPATEAGTAGQESQPVPGESGQTPEAQSMPVPIDDSTQLQPAAATTTGEEASAGEPAAGTARASSAPEPPAATGQTSEQPATPSSDKPPESTAVTDQAPSAPEPPEATGQTSEQSAMPSSDKTPEPTAGTAQASSAPEPPAATDQTSEQPATPSSDKTPEPPAVTDQTSEEPATPSSDKAPEP